MKLIIRDIVYYKSKMNLIKKYRHATNVFEYYL